MGFWYLASPHSTYPDGPDAAFAEVCKASAKLVTNGVHLYSPIAHSHPIWKASAIDIARYDIWLPLDEQFMKASSGRS